MDNSFAQRILNIEDSTVFASSEDFIEYFNGIYVRADNVAGAGEGAILYFDLLNERSNVTIYYSNNDTATANDTLSYTFPINGNSARVGNFEHNYQMSLDNDFKQQILFNDTSLGEQNLYLQGLGGIKTHIRFPGVVDWINSDDPDIQARFMFLSSPNE